MATASPLCRQATAAPARLGSHCNGAYTHFQKLLGALWEKGAGSSVEEMGVCAWE